MINEYIVITINNQCIHNFDIELSMHIGFSGYRILFNNLLILTIRTKIFVEVSHLLLTAI